MLTMPEEDREGLKEAMKAYFVCYFIGMAIVAVCLITAP